MWPSGPVAHKALQPLQGRGWEGEAESAEAKGPSSESHCPTCPTAPPAPACPGGPDELPSRNFLNLLKGPGHSQVRNPGEGRETQGSVYNPCHPSVCPPASLHRWGGGLCPQNGNLRGLMASSNGGLWGDAPGDRERRRDRWGRGEPHFWPGFQHASSMGW